MQGQQGLDLCCFPPFCKIMPRRGQQNNLNLRKKHRTGVLRLRYYLNIYLLAKDSGVEQPKSLDWMWQLLVWKFENPDYHTYQHGGLRWAKWTGDEWIHLLNSIFQICQQNPLASLKDFQEILQNDYGFVPPPSFGRLVACFNRGVGHSKSQMCINSTNILTRILNITQHISTKFKISHGSKSNIVTKVIHEVLPTLFLLESRFNENRSSQTVSSVPNKQACSSCCQYWAYKQTIHTHNCYDIGRRSADPKCFFTSRRDKHSNLIFRVCHIFSWTTTSHGRWLFYNWQHLYPHSRRWAWSIGKSAWCIQY